MILAKVAISKLIWVDCTIAAVDVLCSYAYLGGTTQSPAGLPAFTGGDNSFSAATGIPKNIQSAIWSYDPKTQAITAQWVNTEGPAPASHIVFVIEENSGFFLLNSLIFLIF